MIECQFGHSGHSQKQVAMPWGPFVIHDWQRYFAELDGYPGWCPGRDDVSRTIDMYGYWEQPDTERFDRLIRPSVTVLDFGAHIGWYAIRAAAAGCQVIAFEWLAERRTILAVNAEHAGSVEIRERIGHVDIDGPVVIKADVEGAEDQVVEATRHLWQSGQVIGAMLEVSPEFADYYPNLIAELEGYGYTPDVIGEGWSGMPSSQRNVWFLR